MGSKAHKPKKGNIVDANGVGEVSGVDGVCVVCDDDVGVSGGGGRAAAGVGRGGASSLPAFDFSGAFRSYEV